MNIITKQEIPSIHRAHRNAFVQWFGRTMVKMMGWKAVGEIPDTPRLILSGAPHTSNWDFIIVMCAIMALDVDIHWFGKHSMFKKPFDKIFYKLGGIPLNRNLAEGVVESSAKLIRDSDVMVIAMMPEGTRGKVERFKTGFLRIAHAAGCPVKLVALDYKIKEIIFDKLIEVREDFETQAAEIKSHYKQNFIPKFPERF